MWIYWPNLCCYLLKLALGVLLTCTFNWFFLIIVRFFDFFKFFFHLYFRLNPNFLIKILKLHRQYIWRIIHKLSSNYCFYILWINFHKSPLDQIHLFSNLYKYIFYYHILYCYSYQLISGVNYIISFASYFLNHLPTDFVYIS